MYTTVLCSILTVLGLLQAGQLPERRGTETGTPRSRAPEVQDRRLGPVPVHQDTDGSCEQVLLALDGAPDGGFGAIWMDTRQGNLGLYLGLVGESGDVRGTEVPLYPSSGTARQLQPDLAFTDGLSGMLCWRTGIATKLPIHVRRFRGAPGFRDAPQGFGAAPDAEDLDPRAPVGRGDRGGRGSRGAEPRVAALGGGETLVAWTQAGEALAQHFDAEGQPVGEVKRLDAKGAPTTGSLRVASDGEGRALVAWPTEKGVRVWIGTPQGRSLNANAGPGQLIEAAHDPRGGWWLLLQPEKGSAILRRLNTRGVREPEDRKLPGRLIDRAAKQGFWTGLDLCVWKHGIAIAATSVREKHPVRVLLFDADGRGTGREWHPLAEKDALNARVAGEGPNSERLIAAWTDAREGDRDVYYSLLQPGPNGAVPEAEPAKRWNTDEGSSGQSQPALASNGERALLLWRDARSGTERIWLRSIVAGASASEWEFGGEDMPLPVEVDWSHGEDEPSVAMLPNGDALATWRRMGDDRLFARALDATGAARAGLTEIGPVERGSFLAAGTESFALLARTKDGPLFALALAADGTALGGRSRLSAEGAVGIDNCRLVRLDDGRWLATWDEADGKNRVLVGRLLTAELAPIGPPLEFDRSGRGGDLQPAAAPGPKDGFFMAWTAFDSRARDVAARLYDREGAPVDRPLAISPTYSEQDAAIALRLANGDWVVVWEDDLSRWDQIQARRAFRDAKTMGPAVTLNGMEETFTMGRTGPVAVPLGDGFIAAWADRSRGLGSDVFVTVVGPAFDEL